MPDGGDEMALLLPGCSEKAALRRAEDILRDVRSHQFLLGDAGPVPVSVSVGLAQAPTRTTDLPTLYVAADAALYCAMHSGRTRVVAPA